MSFLCPEIKIHGQQNGCHKKDCDKRQPVPGRIRQLMHFRPSFPAAIAPRFHGGRQIIGAAESGNEERHKKGHHPFGFLPQIPAGKISTAGRLGFHDPIRFLKQRRNEAERDGHHHCQFMGRHAETAERI